MRLGSWAQASATPSKREQIEQGRCRGRFPTTQEGVYLVGMAVRRADQMVGSLLAGVVVPYGQEFRDLGVEEAHSREL
jgi:hypothetical protein